MNTTSTSSSLPAYAPALVPWPESSTSPCPLEEHWAEVKPGLRRWKIAMTRCRSEINSYSDLPPSMALHNQRRAPIFHASPPPYLTLDQEDHYDDQYERLIYSLNLPTAATRGQRSDGASRARKALWQLWFHSRAEWIRRGSPPVNEHTRPYWT